VFGQQPFHGGSADAPEFFPDLMVHWVAGMA
jgi:hypothetical protein